MQKYDSPSGMSYRESIGQALMDGKTLAIPKRWEVREGSLRPILGGDDDLILLGGGEYAGKFYVQAYDKAGAEKAASLIEGKKTENIEPGFWDKVADFFLKIFFSRDEVCRDWEEYHKLDEITPNIGNGSFASKRGGAGEKSVQGKPSEPRLAGLGTEEFRQQLQELSGRREQAELALMQLDRVTGTKAEISTLMLDYVRGAAAENLLNQMEQAADPRQFVQANQKNADNMMFNLKGFVAGQCNGEYRQTIDVLANAGSSAEEKGQAMEQMTRFTQNALKDFQALALTRAAGNDPEPKGEIQAEKSKEDLIVTNNPIGPVLGSP